MRLLAAVLLTLVTVVPAAAQTRPDFTGRWVKVDTSGVTDGWDVPDEIRVRQVMRDRTVSGAPMPPAVSALEIERRIGDVAHTETVTVGIRSGVVGGVTRPGEAPRSLFESAAEWRDERLLIWNSTTQHADDGTDHVSERAQEWSLDADRQLVIAVRSKETGQFSRRGRLVYRRVE